MKKTISAILILSLMIAGFGISSAFAENKQSAAENTDIWDVFYSGSIEDVNKFFTENGMSGGLPVVPPTQTRVNEFLQFTDRAPEDLVAVFKPSNREVLVYHVAVNGVMAGCKPEWMPVLLACAEALNDEGVRNSITGTDGCSPFALLNGPVVRQLGFDNGQGEITEATNMAFGRFVDLALMNMCGLYAGENRNSPFGYVMPWTIVENEELCKEIDWDPYHVQMGFEASDSTVTIASSVSWGANLAPSTAEAEKIKNVIAYDITEKANNALGSGDATSYRTVMVTGAVARDLSKLYTKESFISALIETARRPAALRGYANYWANPEDYVSNNMSLDEYTKEIIEAEGGEYTDAPPWYNGMINSKIYTVPCLKEGEAAVIVTGDTDRNKAQVLAGGSRVTIGIELPENWNELMTELEYEPLESFYLG